MKIGYINSNKDIFIKINKARKFYIILERFVNLLIIIFITFYLSVIARKFLVNYIIENSGDGEIVPNSIIKPILQINDGLESKVEATTDKASFTDKDNVILENILIKGNNDFILRADEGNINTKTGEISLIERPFITIFDN